MIGSADAQAASSRNAVISVRSLLLLVSASLLGAGFPQGPPPPGGGAGNGGPPPRQELRRGPWDQHRSPMDRSMHVGPPGRWWNDSNMAQRIGLTPLQQRKMNQVFDGNRLRLIDLSAALQRQEAILEPLLYADPLDETKILAQIDRVVSARADLERANSAMLLGLRTVLSVEQWQHLQADDPRDRPEH